MNTHRGFTLIELMIVIAIISILSSIAIPSFLTYFNRSRFSEVILAAANKKTVIEVCSQANIFTNFKTDCSGGNFNINNELNSSPYTSSVVIAGGSTDNKVTITATSRGLNTDQTYILEATLANGNITWDILPTSGCITKDWC